MSPTSSETKSSKSWHDELATLVNTSSENVFSYGGVDERVVGGESGSVKDQIVEFLKASGEMVVELGRGCRDIVKQSLGNEDSVIVKKFGGPCRAVCEKFSFLNEYLPEDRDPVHSWSVILFVLVIAFAALNVNNVHHTPSPTPLVKKVYIHPPNATRILLPDGRYLAYEERGVPADKARFSVITLHSFLSSRLAGIPGLKSSLLEEYGIRLVTYDLPGFGESDPHPDRNLESSARDMLHLADALGVSDKFWVVGHSSGAMHAWAALRYIPDRLAGAAMLAPVVNPYESSLTKEEREKIWKKWTPKKKFMYFIARRMPGLLAFFYRQSFLSGRHGQIDKWLFLSLGTRDRALIMDPVFEEFWQRDVEESVRQGSTKPFVEEAALQVSDWGFSLSDLKIHNNRQPKGIFDWLKSMYSDAEQELVGFLGSIHIWQGMDDSVVPPSSTDFIHRILPSAAVHKLPNEGHYTYFYFCDECHRQIMTTLFGTPRGPLDKITGEDHASTDQDTDVMQEQADNGAE
ncbi:Alpha/beta hydrolase fold-1 [Dillenia turbinata]|uniref:Alpha/beta hydrolase fold-1 n=1 Tax=Dillenia turbinata TaxID=194707 RepID=A0AAN8ZFC9_9MAGN